MRTILQLSLLVLTGVALSACSVATMQVMSDEQQMVFSGKYEEVIRKIDAEYPSAKQKVILQKSVSLIQTMRDRAAIQSQKQPRNQHDVASNLSSNLTFILTTQRVVTQEVGSYLSNMILLVEALQETERFSRASSVCERTIREIESIRKMQKKTGQKIFSDKLFEANLMRLRINNASIIWGLTGNRKKALEQFDRIAIDKADTLQQLLYHLQLGFFYDRKLADYQKAISSFSQVLKLSKKLSFTDIDSKFAYSMQASRRLVHLYMKMGKLQKAKDVLAQYEEMNSSSLLSAGKFLLKKAQYFSGYLATMDIMAGNLYALLHEFDKSMEYFDSSWDIIKDFDPNSDELWDQMSFGAYYIMYGTAYEGLQGRYKEAIESVQKGIRHLERVTSRSMMEIDIESAHIYLAELYYLKGEKEKAFTESKKAEKLAKRYKNYVAAARALTLQGTIELETGKTKNALKSLRKALSLIGKTESSENWRLYHTLGLAYEKIGNNNNALKYYKRAVHEVEKLWDGRLKNTLKQLSLMENRLVVFEPLITMLVKKNRDAEALTYMEKAKARGLYESSAFVNQQSRNRAVASKPLSVKKIQHALPKRTAVLEYYVGKKVIIGAVVTRRRVNAKLLAGSASDLKADIYQFRNMLQPGFDLARGIRIKAAPKTTSRKALPLPAGYTGAARGLYNQLVRPFSSDLKKKYDHLCIVPHGVLHYLPFHALATSYSGSGKKLKGSGRDLARRGIKIKKKQEHSVAVTRIEPAGVSEKIIWLIEKYPISYSPSSSLLIATRKKNRRKRSSLLAVGSPPDISKVDIGADELYDLEKLTGAEQEIKTVSMLFHDPPVYLDRDATETVVKENSGRADVLLFSTHGILMRNDPLRSSLFFRKDGKNDGRLTVREIEKMKNHSNLVVLSACQAGLLAGRQGVKENLADASFPPGDDLFGLQRAFLGAGASSVLSTLWSVADESTASLVSDFFQFYKVQGMDKSQALQKAELKLLTEHPDWNNPFYWAPFMLSGDWL